MLRIVAVLMVVLGSGGLVSSALVFGPVEGELAKIDATVQNVAQTVVYAADGVDAATGALDQGVGSIVAFLDSTAKGLSETSGVVSGAKTSVENAAKQIPVVVNSTANTVEGAARSLTSARQDLTAAADEITGLRSSLDLAGLQASTLEQKASLTGQVATFSGQDLINAAPWLAAQTGMPQSVFVDEGTRLVQSGKSLSISMDSLKASGQDLVELADMTENLLFLDASAIRAEGQAALQNGIEWAFVLPLERVDQIAASMTELDGVLNAAGSTLANSGTEIASLGANLNENARTIRATVPDVLGVTAQAEQFLTVAGKELAVVDSSLQDVAKQIGSFNGVASDQLSQINTGLRGTAAEMGGISIANLGGSVVKGLRTYMMLTSSLFILTGLGLIAGTFRPDLGGLTAGTRAA